MPTHYEINFSAGQKADPGSIVRANKIVPKSAVPPSVIRGRSTEKTESDLSDAAHAALNPKRYMGKVFGEYDDETVHTRLKAVGTGRPNDPLLGHASPATERSTFREQREFDAAERKYKALLDIENPTTKQRIAVLRAELEVIEAKEKMDMALRIRAGKGRGGRGTNTSTSSVAERGRSPEMGGRFDAFSAADASYAQVRFYNSSIPPEITRKVLSLQRVEQQATGLATRTMMFDTLSLRPRASLPGSRTKVGRKGGRKRESPNARRRRQMSRPLRGTSNTTDDYERRNQFLRADDRRHRNRRAQRRASASKIQARVRGWQARKAYRARRNELGMPDRTMRTTRRSRSSRRGQGEREEATRKIQAMYRGRATRRDLRERQEASRRIQALHRGRTERRAHTRRRQLKRRQEDMDAASRKIQAAHRGRMTRRDQVERRRASLKIQSLHRGRLSRRRSKKIPPRISRIALRSGLRLLFDEADLNGDGLIDANELMRLMFELPKQYSVNPKSIPLPAEAGQVMLALDADGSGEIDYSEWEDWIMSNHALTYRERTAFAAQSASHRRFDNFAQSIVAIATSKIRRLGGISKQALCAGLKLLFDEADLDQNNSIDIEELRTLMIEIPRRYSIPVENIPREKDADLVMLALDADKNGKVDYSEWERWVLSNRNMTEADAERFSALSPTHKRMDTFVETLVGIASKKIKKVGGDELLSGIKMVFATYDANKDGQIDADELT